MPTADSERRAPAHHQAHLQAVQHRVGAITGAELAPAAGEVALDGERGELPPTAAASHDGNRSGRNDHRSNPVRRDLASQLASRQPGQARWRHARNA